jgi:opacity protein-like surface antigen
MKRSIPVLLLLALSATASAEGFDYSYLQLNYTNLDFDSINADGDGVGLSGSYALNSDWHVFGEFQTADLDFSVDSTKIVAGAGYNTEISPLLDMYARLSYQSIDLDDPGPGSFDYDGFGLGVGVRYEANQEIELNAGIEYLDFDGVGDDTSISIGGLYNFNDAFALGFGGSWGDETSSYMLSGRIYFGR